MNRTPQAALQEGALDDVLTRLYGPQALEGARLRVDAVLAGYRKAFAAEPEGLFSAPGRTELGGNHTDHQHGHVLAGAVDLDVLCAASPNQSGLVRVQSEGYALIEVNMDDLSPKPEEENTSAALIRGVAARMKSLGCPLLGVGLDAYMVSNVPGGSGLSSSAAFEILLGVLFNELFWEGKATAVELAQIGQYAENVYFGKPCGLMDQAAASVGGVVAIDFQDPSAPVVDQVELDLRSQGYALCILDSGAGHADLTGEYAAVTDELKAVSRYFGKEFLRDIPEADFFSAIPQLRRVAGDRAVLRGIHFYNEDQRAAQQAQALRSGDFEGFLALVRASGHSSAQFLQNVIPTGQTVDQSLMLTIALSQRLLKGKGAGRVHGGGFGGTAQAFVPLDTLESFKAGMETVLGPGACHVVSIRPVGGVRIA